MHPAPTLFHTAQSHVARFNTLRDRIAPGQPLTHVVRADWLVRAQGGISAALATEIAQTIDSAPGARLCTCTTIGPVAKGALRIDAPMMQAAAAIDGPLCLAYCLQSTAQPSLDLLTTCLPASRPIAQLYLPNAWAAFTQGDTAGFEAEIAHAVMAHLAQNPGTKGIILAQASMSGAADLLTDCGARVLSSPELALRALLAPT